LISLLKSKVRKVKYQITMLQININIKKYYIKNWLFIKKTISSK
jgi:hypothetical protein